MVWLREWCVGNVKQICLLLTLESGNGIRIKDDDTSTFHRHELNPLPIVRAIEKGSGS